MPQTSQQQQQQQPEDLSQTSRSFDDTAAPPRASPHDARARANTAPADVPERTPEDEELQQAKAMALAYSSNPHLSVDQAQKMGKNFAKLKKSFRFERARNILKGSSSSAADGGGSNDHHEGIISRGPFRQRQLTPRSPPLSPAAANTGGGDLSHNSAVGESDDEIREIPSRPPPVMPSYNSSIPISGGTTTPSNMIQLTGLAWKRRGGMGKYSATSAWERRRIELRGRKLLYYKTESDEADEEDDSHSPDGLTTAIPSSSEEVAEGIVVSRRSSWIEQAFTSTMNVGETDPTMPRGEMDLVKEKAVVAATLGHTGAPSPFAISIKCRGETKWKLCFDHHKDQMEWLAALTDVTVNASVDAYNSLLLQMADPSYIPDGPTALFASAISAPPGTQQRLWQMESYNISNERSASDACLEDAIGPSDVMEELEAEEMNGVAALDRGASTTETSSSSVMTGSWMVPQHNFLLVAAVVNAALGVARASATSLEGFWYLVALANLGMYLCTVQETKTEIVRIVPVAGKAALNTTRRNEAATGRKGPISSTKSKEVGKDKRKAGFKPIAGTTTVKLKNPTDPPANARGQLFAGWRCPSAEVLQVRGLGYATLKKKQPSPGELYNCTQVEVFESPSRYPDMAPRVHLPKVEFKDDGPKTWRTPDIFVVSIALPTDPPKLGRSSSDGGGYTVTMYFTMKQETRDILRRVTAEGYDPSKENPDDPSRSKVNAVRLLEEWIRRAPNDPSWFSRFKCVPNAHNLKEIGMPGWISNYNGKPFLIKRPGVTGFIHHHPELSCLEFDISLHPFPYLAKQGICFMKDSYFKKVLVTFGFVIEGKTDDELPECVLGCMQLCYPDPIHAIQASDFFAGTSPRSF